MTSNGTATPKEIRYGTLAHPIPVEPPADWEDEAACVGLDPEMFFQHSKQHGPALEICSACPVKAPCLELGLAFIEVGSGIFGGATPAEREAILRERGVLS